MVAVRAGGDVQQERRFNHVNPVPLPGARMQASPGPSSIGRSGSDSIVISSRRSS